MATIVTRAGKGSPLTNNEIDANFNNLNTDKIETSLITTSATDTTAGRLLKVGDFGLGGNGPVVVDIDDLQLTSGFYNITPATVSGTIPESLTTGLLHVQARVLSVGTEQAIQIFYSNTSDAAVYIRRATAGAWGAWKKIYTHANILGTVSESSGVPTGAVIESGSNANGQFVKFADGTMICTLRGLVLSTISGDFLQATWTFPATFFTTIGLATAANCLPSAINTESRKVSLGGAASESTTTATIRAQAATGESWVGGNQVMANPTAIGRWF